MSLFIKILYGVSMDKLEYMSASEEFAIMRMGSPSKWSVEKELEELLDMRPESAEFVKRQLQPFLERYGHQFVWNGMLQVIGDGEDEERLAELGYTIYRDKSIGRYLIHKHNSQMGLDTYVVAVDSQYYEVTTLMAKRAALYYVAELGLVSQGYESKDIFLTPVFDKLYQTATYAINPPSSLWLDPQGTDEAGRWALLTGTLTEGSEQAPTTFGGLNMVSENGANKWTLPLFLRGYNICDENGAPKYPDWIKTRSDGSPDEKSLNMIAAGQLLSLIAERYHFRQRSFVVDSVTLKLKVNDTPYLMGELVRCVALGKVHPCAHCGRPVMGRTWYCRGRRCKATDLEKARLLAASGRGANEILAIYPHIKRITIEGYVEDARRGLQ